jgi:hypothetical protein
MEKQELTKKKGRWKSMKRWKRGLIITSIVLVSLIAVIFACLSSIAEYLIEKYDVKYTGREIEMDWMFINVFTGYVHVENLTIYEAESDSVFFSLNGLSADLAMHDLFTKTYTIESLTLNKPYAKIIQDKKKLNFDDLILRFSPDSTEVPDTTKPPVKLNILNVEINDGEFHYIEKDIPVNYFVKEVNVETKGYRWDEDLVDVTFALKNGPGSGNIKGDANIDLASMDYKVAVVIDTFDLQIMEQYIKDLANYGRFRGILDLDVKAAGNVNDQTNMMATGMVKVSDMHFGKTLEDDYVSFEQLHLQMKEVSPKHFDYIFDSVILTKPYFKYERYDDKLDNVSTMFGRGGSNIKDAKAAQDAGQKNNLIFMISDFIEVLAKNFLKSHYSVGRVAIYDADIHFNDYAITEKFAIAANPLTIIADSLDKNNNRMKATLKTGLKPSGNIYVGVSINPNNFNDFDITYRVNKIPVAAFNPYLITFTSFPADRGTVELKGDWHVRNGNIDSRNNLLMLDPRFADRLKRSGNKWIPMRLILSILRSRGNVIDYDVPIKGSLKDPKFNVWDIVGDVLTNIFVKPPSLGYILKVKTTERELERSLTLKWNMRTTELVRKQQKFIDQMGDFLVENPNARITVQPLVYVEKEKEYILFFEAKKKYYKTIKNIKTLTKSDSAVIDKMHIKDSMLVKHLNKHANGPLIFTIQEKCEKYVGKDIVNAEYNKLMKERERIFRSNFKDVGVNKRVSFTGITNSVPYNGFSYYKIDYKGEFPEKLLNAYNDMHDLNKTKPRKKYEKKREKLGAPVIENKEIKQKAKAR